MMDERRHSSFRTPIPLLILVALLVTGCQVQEVVRSALNRGEAPPRSEEPIIPAIDEQIRQGHLPDADTNNAASADSTPPEIRIWEGSEQDFAYESAQRWINVQGKALDPESGIRSLHYTVNEDAQKRALNLGPTNRRLAGIGDFNVEIDASILRDGENLVTIYAVNGAGIDTKTAVTIRYQPRKSWPLPYQIDWPAVDDLQQAVQVVDGTWMITPQGVRTQQVGYDRVLAIGEIDWKDYEVTVPVTLHAVDARAYNHRISANPGFGVNLRWTGHTNDPPACEQPLCGWNPTGSSNWVEFREEQPALLKLIAEPPQGAETLEIPIELGQTYWIKARAETNDSGTRYALKFWKDGTNEPPDWTLTRQASRDNLTAGSLLLVAHHVDVTFGRLIVTPLP